MEIKILRPLFICKMGLTYLSQKVTISCASSPGGKEEPFFPVTISKNNQTEYYKQIDMMCLPPSSEQQTPHWNPVNPEEIHCSSGQAEKPLSCLTTN